MTQDLLADQDDTIDPTKDYFAELVGEGKKFKTPQELARGKAEADSYVKLLEKQKDELRADYLKVMDENKAKAKLEDLITQYEQRLASSEQPLVKEVMEQPKFNPEQIESLIDNALIKRTQEQRQSDNFNAVKDKLTERFGRNYQNVVKQQIEELGISVDEFNDMARRTPKVLIKTLGLDTPVNNETFQAPIRSTQQFRPTGQQKRDWDYYQELKKTNPKIYLDPKTTVQMHNDVLEMGEAAFYGTHLNEL